MNAHRGSDWMRRVTSLMFNRMASTGGQSKPPKPALNPHLAHSTYLLLFYVDNGDGLDNDGVGQPAGRSS